MLRYPAKLCCKVRPHAKEYSYKTIGDDMPAQLSYGICALSLKMKREDRIGKTIGYLTYRISGRRSGVEAMSHSETDRGSYRGNIESSLRADNKADLWIERRWTARRTILHHYQVHRLAIRCVLYESSIERLKRRLRSQLAKH